MNAQDIVKALMEEQGVNQTTMGKRIGTQQKAVWANLYKQKKISTDKMVQMLDALDYELVAQPKSRGRRAEGSFLVS